jgi:hypothetical protein
MNLNRDGISHALADVMMAEQRLKEESRNTSYDLQNAVFGEVAESIKHYGRALSIDLPERASMLYQRMFTMEIGDGATGFDPAITLLQLVFAGEPLSDSDKKQLLGFLAVYKDYLKELRKTLM